MYKVKKHIVSLAHGKEFAIGNQLYGNEFPQYALDAMVADGTIEEVAPGISPEYPEAQAAQAAIEALKTKPEEEEPAEGEAGEPAPDEMLELKHLAELLEEDEAAQDEAPTSEDEKQKETRITKSRGKAHG